jgi:hypothetical protein
MIEAAAFFRLPKTLDAPASQGADRFKYIITVEMEGKRHTVRTSDAAPAALQNLIDFLLSLARKKKRGDKPDD